MVAHEVLCLRRRTTVATDVAEFAAPLVARGWRVHEVHDAQGVRQVLARHAVAVGLLWCPTLDDDSLARLQVCLAQAPELEWVGAFDAGTVEQAGVCEWVLACFFDHLRHPADPEELDRTLRHALARARLRQRSVGVPHLVDEQGMVGQSPAMQQLRQQLRKVASTDAPVLLGGESGSGKELAARAIHNGSRRALQPFVAVNCGAIAPTLIQSELFGHERGAFTGATTAKPGLIEAAHHGTIFLDEIGDLPLDLQATLLRFLQEHTIQRLGSTRSIDVDVRVLAATHVDLGQAVSAGRFREDLFYRLNVLPVVVPSLRDRCVDIPLLAEHVLRRCSAADPLRRIDGFTQQAMTALMVHPWPGNVRELCNRVQRALVMTDARLITPEDLGLQAPEEAPGPGLDAARTQAERDLIAVTLGRLHSNVSQAARELGVSRMTLYRLMDKHGLSGRMPPLRPRSR